MLHIRNMEQAIIKFLDWFTNGYVGDLELQNEVYKKNLDDYRKIIIEKEIELNQARDLLKNYRNKEARIKIQKRQSYLRLKQK